MAIPEAQLETWAGQGSITQSSATYATIKTALESDGNSYSGRGYSIFLQGSYGNDTNVYADSDVDVVINLRECWMRDLDLLSGPEKVAYEGAYPTATYTLDHFKPDVVSVLNSRFAGQVTTGNKAIAIASSASRRKADVIVSMQFKRYYKFNSVFDQSYEEGICFYDKSRSLLVNYPKQHSQNLTAKHQRSQKWLKPMVRVLKNMRGKLIGEGYLTAADAPSYFLEGLLYNVPDEHFIASFQSCFVNAMNWLSDTDKSKLLCANEQFYLVREGVSNCWGQAGCDKFIEAATEIWNGW